VRDRCGAAWLRWGRPTPMDFYKSVLITVLYYFLKIKTSAGNRKDPNNIFIWLRPWCVIYRSC